MRRRRTEKGKGLEKENRRLAKHKEENMRNAEKNSDRSVSALSNQKRKKRIDNGIFTRKIFHGTRLKTDR